MTTAIPNNAVIIEGKPLEHNLIADTHNIANAIPGRLVMRGSVGGPTHFEPCEDEGRDGGIIPFHEAGAVGVPANIATAWAAGAEVNILSGPIKWRAHLAANQGFLPMFHKLVPAANGTVKRQVGAMTYCAILEQDANNSASIQIVAARYVH
ncbi:hypothetical protein KKH23_09025 [Patescibacteria group bacterium]|nr:hypothetical protein [Patescibacteria group bacterium]MBU1008374.1 hypothetical protein [Candidatus Dependentiae bacterium]